ncbi:MAG: hypothetical protein NTU89_02890 [Candidatus Dependentiae bacterium]|nr:hypothetical protein [Candidatus Dependentiae bacterium]
MNNFFSNSLFFKSSVLAGRELKSKPGFWALLYAKFFFAAMGASILLIIGSILGLAGLLGLSKAFAVGFPSISPLFLVELASFVRQGGAMVYVSLGLILALSILFLSAFLYGMLNFSVIFFANSLDAARGNAPRGMVRTPHVFRFFPLFVFGFLLGWPYTFAADSTLRFIIPLMFFMKYYIFYSRTIFAYGFMLDGSSFIQALKQSWSATSNKGFQMCLFGLFYLLIDSMAKVNSLMVGYGVAAIIVGLIVFTSIAAISHLFYCLMFAYSYISLKEESKN